MLENLQHQLSLTNHSPWQQQGNLAFQGALFVLKPYANNQQH
jgi:hypothetical protein